MNDALDFRVVRMCVASRTPLLLLLECLCDIWRGARLQHPDLAGLAEIGFGQRAVEGSAWTRKHNTQGRKGSEHTEIREGRPVEAHLRGGRCARQCFMVVVTDCSWRMPVPPSLAA